MKHYKAAYLIHADIDKLELDVTDNNSLTVWEVKKVSHEDLTTSIFSVKISFSAESNSEALRMSAINTDQSLLVFTDDCKLINYHVLLEEKRWLGKRTLEDQFFTFSSLSA